MKKNLYNWIHALLCVGCGLILLCTVAACGDEPVKEDNLEENQPEQPETPENPEEPDGPGDIEEPYIYDDDLDYDAEAFLSAYAGTPYSSSHTVPGVIEAEDFDEGDKLAAFEEKDDKVAVEDYRGLHAVDIRSSSNASGGYYIGDVHSGEWLSYTIEVTEDGEYAIDTYIVKGDGSDGRFYFELDGRGVTRNVSIPQGSWTDFTRKTTVRGVQLTKGKHVLTFYAGSSGNLDKFELRKTGAWTGFSLSFQYPVTKVMKNPLFVNFESPMYNSWMKGPLYTADASAHVWNIDGREVLYVYASHDMEPAVGCDHMDRYHVFSTEDMQSWTDHGEILNAATVRLQAGWGIDGFMWAPDCAYNPDKQLYYFYFPHPYDASDRENSWRIGVATSKYPDKEFRVVGYVRGMPSKIDPCVFVDDDGQPYIYNGGGGECYGGKLRKDDWMQLDGVMERMEGLEDFHEATWVHKYNGRYYLSHSDNNSMEDGGNRMRYAVSDSPLGPWKSLGIYMEPTGIETNHGSIVLFKGQWYAFYHTGTYSGKGNLRSVCVEPLTINADGTLNLVK